LANDYTISVGTFPLPGGQGHLVIAAQDSSGNIVFEIDGFSTNASGNRTPIGPPWDFTDTIQTYVFDRNELFLHTQNRQVIFTGSLEEIRFIQNISLSLAAKINEQNIDYSASRLFGANSNSVAYTFLKLFGVDYAWDKSHVGLPGYGKLLVPQSVIDALRSIELETKCFPAATSIMMSDGQSKAIKDIKVGDVIMAYNPTPGFVSRRTLEVE
jgi:hypothetical protein